MRDHISFSSRKGRGTASLWDEPDDDDIMLGDKQYIPPSLRSQINRTFYRAWCDAFRSIYNILQGPNPILSPTSPTFLLAMMDFASRGGKAEHVLDALTGTAIDQSFLGDGTFEEDHCESYDELPTCDNDLAFNLVRRKIGLDPRSAWSPYYDPEAFDDSDSDDSDD